MGKVKSIETQLKLFLSLFDEGIKEISQRLKIISNLTSLLRKSCEVN